MILFSIPDFSSSNAIADWVELYICINQEEVSKAMLSSYIEESSGFEPREEDVDGIWVELGFRELLYGEDPPFTVESQVVRCNFCWENHPEYITCLIFSVFGNPTNTTRSANLFEKISSKAAKNYLGGESLIYGTQSNMNVEELARCLNERFGYEPPSSRKDRNLDVVVWKPFGDNRKSQMIVLMQCAAGKNWKSKLTELSIRAWSRYINFACEPIRAFSVPIAISDNEVLEEISLDGGLIIDRPRIYRYTKGYDVDINLEKELKVWCMERINEEQE